MLALSISKSMHTGDAGAGSGAGGKSRGKGKGKRLTKAEKNLRKPIPELVLSTQQEKEAGVRARVQAVLLPISGGRGVLLPISGGRTRSTRRHPQPHSEPTSGSAGSTVAGGWNGRACDPIAASPTLRPSNRPRVNPDKWQMCGCSSSVCCSHLWQRHPHRTARSSNRVSC